MSVDPIQTIKKLQMNENEKLNSLVLIHPQTNKIKGEIKTLIQQVCRYGVRNSFNYSIYLFMI